MSASTEINLFEFVRSGQSRAGTLALADMGRLDAMQREGTLQWQITGFCGRHGKLFFDLDVNGTVVVICQRCLEPVKLKVEFHRHFLVAKTEQEADAVPMDDDAIEVVVGSENFDLATLVEDEVILSLPIVPMHQLCCHDVQAEPILEADVADTAVAKVSPFAALSDLKPGASRQKN